jgi:hypothetical protein
VGRHAGTLPALRKAVKVVHRGRPLAAERTSRCRRAAGTLRSLRPAAVAFPEDCSEPLPISAITVAELLAGVREGQERAALDTFIAAFDVVPVTAEVAVRGGPLRRDHGKAHGTGLADALLAATAELRQARLVKRNRKQFPMLPNVLVPYRK